MLFPKGKGLKIRQTGNSVDTMHINNNLKIPYGQYSNEKTLLTGYIADLNIITKNIIQYFIHKILLILFYFFQNIIQYFINKIILILFFIFFRCKS